MKMIKKLKEFFLKGRLWVDNRGFGMNELLGIAAALIIAGFVIIPGFKTLAKSMILKLTEWWGKVEVEIFTIK